MRPRVEGMGPRHRRGLNVRRAVFLDRDGTIIAEREHLADPAHVELLPGAAPGLRRLKHAGYELVLITNQSGLARGLFGPLEFRAVQGRLAELLAAEGVSFDGVYHCPHHPDITGRCECRKPALGLFHRAAEELGLDPARSVFVGDRVRDTVPAHAFGGTGILVRTGYGGTEARVAPPGIAVVDDIAAAAAHVLQRNEGPERPGAA